MEEHSEPRYVLIWFVLLALTVGEVGYAFLDLPKIWLAVGLIILALWKAMNIKKNSSETEFRFCNRHLLVSPAYCRYPRFFGPPVPAAPSPRASHASQRSC